MVADYYSGHLLPQRKAAGANAVNARLVAAIADVATEPADSLTRRQVFDLVDALSDTPVAAKSVRNEMGAAMALALDAGQDLANQMTLHAIGLDQDKSAFNCHGGLLFGWDEPTETVRPAPASCDP